MGTVGSAVMLLFTRQLAAAMNNTLAYWPRAYLQALPDMDEVPRQRQAHHQLKKRLNKLAGCRRHHVLLPLGKAPVGTHDGYAYHRNAQAFDGPVGQGVVHGRSQLPGKKQHNAGGCWRSVSRLPWGRRE